MTADDDLAVERELPRRGVARARGVGGAQREAVDIGAIERRHVDRRRHVVRQHAVERRRERHRLRGKRRQIEMTRKSRARLLGRDHFEELLLPRGAADRGNELVGCLSSAGEIGRSWPGLYHDLGAGRISLAVGGDQNPSIGLRERRERQIARGYGLRFAIANAHRNDFGEAQRRGDLARELGARRWAALRRSRQAAPASAGRAGAMRRARRRGGRARSGPAAAPTTPNAAVSPGEIAMPCASTRPRRGERVHAAIVPAAAGAADDDRRVGVRAAKRRREFAGRPCTTSVAFGRKRARDQSGYGIKNSVARRPRPDQLNARRADRHLADPGRRQRRDVDAAQPFARPPQHRSRTHIAVRRQYALAGRDLRQDLVTAIAHGHGIERRDRVGPRRQRLARIDAHRGHREHRRRIAARVGRRVRRKREAVAQGARRRGNACRGDDIGGEHQPAGATQCRRPAAQPAPPARRCAQARPSAASAGQSAAGIRFHRPSRLSI